MGIPNNDTFSLQDVADYLQKSGEDNLVGLFNAAQDDEFDPNYEGNQDRLSNFRNYGGVKDLEMKWQKHIGSWKGWV